MDKEFVITIRVKDGGSSITEFVKSDVVKHLIFLDRSDDSPSMEEVSGWIDQWFESCPSSIDSQEIVYGSYPNLPKWTIVRVK